MEATHAKVSRRPGELVRMWRTSFCPPRITRPVRASRRSRRGSGSRPNRVEYSGATAPDSHRLPNFAIGGENTEGNQTLSNPSRRPTSENFGSTLTGSGWGNFARRVLRSFDRMALRAFASSASRRDLSATVPNKVDVSNLTQVALVFSMATVQVCRSR
jgi:hypothetical protein